MTNETQPTDTTAPETPQADQAPAPPEPAPQVQVVEPPVRPSRKTAPTAVMEFYGEQGSWAWEEAPISGATDQTLYTRKNFGHPVNEVTMGAVYWAQPPLRVTITPNA